MLPVTPFSRREPLIRKLQDLFQIASISVATYGDGMHRELVALHRLQSIYATFC